MCGPGVPVGCKSGHRKPLMCGPGVPVGCKSGHKKPLMCGAGVPVGCKSGHKKPLMCGAGWLLAAGWSMRSQRFKGFTVLKGLEGFKRLEGLEGLEGLERFKGLEGFRAGKRQTWTPIRSHWCVALGCLLAARVAIRSHWCVARGGCWLQGEVWRVLGLANGRSYWCGLMAARWVWPWKAKKEKFHTCGGPRRRPCLGQGRGRRIFLLKILLKSASKSSFFRFGVEIRFWSCNFRPRCA